MQDSSDFPSPPRPAPPLEYSAPSELRADAATLSENRVVDGALLVTGSACMAFGLVIVWYAFRQAVGPGLLLIEAGAVLVAVAVWRLRRRKVRLVIDRSGITDYSPAGLGLVPWTQITAVRIARDDKRPFLCLTLLDPQLVPPGAGRPSAWRPAPYDLGPNEVAINVSFLNKKSREVLALVEEYRRSAPSEQAPGSPGVIPAGGPESVDDTGALSLSRYSGRGRGRISARRAATGFRR